MRGILIGTGTAALAALAIVAPAADARGGNHGCNEADRSFYENHFFPSGDNVVAGHVDVDPTLRAAPAVRGITPALQERVKTADTGDAGEGTNSNICGASVDGFWTLFTSDLGTGDDTLRMDGRGLDEPDYDYGPLPRTIGSLVKGGAGADVIRGHDGFDDMNGGTGRDVLIGRGDRDRMRGGVGGDILRARDNRKDNVNCGPGRDKATVDANDDTSGCERVVER